MKHIQAALAHEGVMNVQCYSSDDERFAVFEARMDWLNLSTEGKPVGTESGFFSTVEEAIAELERVLSQQFDDSL